MCVGHVVGVGGVAYTEKLLVTKNNNLIAANQTWALIKAGNTEEEKAMSVCYVYKTRVSSAHVVGLNVEYF